MKIRNYKRMSDKNLVKEYDTAKASNQTNYCVLLMEEINMRKRALHEALSEAVCTGELLPEEAHAEEAASPFATPKKMVDSKVLIKNIILYLRKYNVRVIDLHFDSLTHITQIVLPYSKSMDVSDKEFCEWYLNAADIQAIAKSAGTVLKKNQVIRLAKNPKGHIVALVNPAILKGGK